MMARKGTTRPTTNTMAVRDAEIQKEAGSVLRLKIFDVDRNTFQKDYEQNKSQQSQTAMRDADDGG